MGCLVMIWRFLIYHYLQARTPGRHKKMLAQWNVYKYNEIDYHITNGSENNIRNQRADQ